MYEGLVADIFGIRWNTISGGPPDLQVLVANKYEPEVLLWIDVPYVSSYIQEVKVEAKDGSA
jgi:hypothetical protein